MSLLSKLTPCAKRTAQEEQICHDSLLLMCVETIISMSITRIDLLGDVYNEQAKKDVVTVQNSIANIWPQ